MKFVSFVLNIALLFGVMSPAFAGTGSLIPATVASEETKPEASEHSTMVCPRHTDPEDCLPLMPKERDIYLNQIYEYAISLLITWDLAHNQPPKLYLYDFDEEDEDDDEGSFTIQGLDIALPGNPYRKASADKVAFLPSDAESWDYSLKDWKSGLDYRENLIKIAEGILEESAQKKLITVKGSRELILDGLLKRKVFYTKEEYNSQLNLQQKAADLLYYSANEIITRPLEAAEESALKAFIAYQKREIEIFKEFLTKFSHLSFHEAMQHPDIKSYFLYGIKPAHKLINVEFLQAKEHGDAEVIVFDWGYKHNTDHLKIKGKLTKKEAEKFVTHGQQVAGVLAAKEELAQLKGVAPGATVVPISELTPEAVNQMRNSTARVINISAQFYVPLSCASAFEKLSIEKKNSAMVSKDESTVAPECKVLWDFVEMVHNKDMLIVQSAGNEGLQLDKVDFKNGKVIEDFAFNIVGAQYYNNMYNYKADEVDLSSIFDQIPQLKDRVVLAGNLFRDGVTIAQSSSLPGAFPKDFIYAPSEGISTLGKGYLGRRTQAKRDPENLKKMLKDEQGKIIPEMYPEGGVIYEDVYGEIEEFGGTSGAAPRISGVFVLLGKLFPDLSMPEIRRCVLETGDAFWLESNNRFTKLTDLAKTSGYDLKKPEPGGAEAEIWKYLARLYGRGRINAMAAYHKCFEMQEVKRQKNIGRSALDLGVAKKPLKK